MFFKAVKNVGPDIAKHSLSDNVFEASKYHKEWKFQIGDCLRVSVMEHHKIPNVLQRFFLRKFFDFRWTKI